MKRWKQLLAALLCLCLCSAPAAATSPPKPELEGEIAPLAWRPGEVVETWIGEAYTSVTGHAYGMQTFSFVRYYSDGTKEIKTSTQSSGYTDKKFYVGDVLAYCVESGKGFYGGDYTGSDSGTSNYLKLLTPQAQRGIMLAMLCGYNPAYPQGMPSAKEVGCAFNVDDFAFATQVIVWEYQSNLRTSPTKIGSYSYAGRTIGANNYVRWIEGYPAKNCYDWILKQMAQHETVPSFAGDQVHTMVYDVEQGKYTVTLTDTHNTGEDIVFSQTSGITVERNGNQYTFATSQSISNPVTLVSQKDVPAHTGGFLIWSNGVGQTLATGAQDPVYFTVKLTTQPTGSLDVTKTGKDGQGLSGVRLQLRDEQGNVVWWEVQKDGSYAACATGTGVDTITTDQNGKAKLWRLPYGAYTLEEVGTQSGYQLLTQPVSITVSGSHSVHLRNTPVFALPATGGWDIWMVGTGMALAVVWVAWSYHRRNQNGRKRT